MHKISLLKVNKRGFRCICTKDLGKLCDFPSNEVARSKKGICSSQRNHTLYILRDTSYLIVKPICYFLRDIGYLVVKPIATLIKTNQKLINNGELVNKTCGKKLIC